MPSETRAHKERARLTTHSASDSAGAEDDGERGRQDGCGVVGISAWEGFALRVHSWDWKWGRAMVGCPDYGRRSGVLMGRGTATRLCSAISACSVAPTDALFIRLKTRSDDIRQKLDV